MLNVTQFATSGKLKSLAHFVILPSKIKVENRIFFFFNQSTGCVSEKILANLNTRDLPMVNDISSQDAARTDSNWGSW